MQRAIVRLSILHPFDADLDISRLSPLGTSIGLVLLIGFSFSRGMSPPQEKSCYVVETSVGPGGARWAELHAYTDLRHVRHCIDRFCHNGGGDPAYLGIHYGATLSVWTIQRGVVTDFLDLHPFIEVKLGDQPAVKLDDNED